MKYELWYSEKENSFTFFAKGESYSHNYALLENDAQMLWEYDAKSHFDAMRAYHEYMGFEPYKPEPDWEDVIYGESEDNSEHTVSSDSGCGDS